MVENDLRRTPPKASWYPLAAFPAYDTVSVTNSADLKYGVKLWFGSTNTELTLIPDIRSYRLAVCAGIASTCRGDKFEYDNAYTPSTSFVKNTTEYS